MTEHQKAFEDARKLCDGLRNGTFTCSEFREHFSRFIPDLSDAAAKEISEAIFYWDIWLRDAGGDED